MSFDRIRSQTAGIIVFYLSLAAVICIVPKNAASDDPAPAPVILDEQGIINRVLKFNRNIEFAADRVEIAQLQLQQSRNDLNIKLYPEIDMGLSGTNNEEDEVQFDWNSGFSLRKQMIAGGDISVSPSLGKTEGNYSSRLTVSIDQPLLQGRGKESALSNVKGAESNFLRTRMQHFRTQVTMIQTALNTAYQAVKWRETTRLLEESLTRIRTHTAALGAKMKLGHTGAMDLYRAEIERKNTENQLQSSQEQYEAALDSLKNILSLPLEQNLRLKMAIENALELPSLEHAVNTALQRRIEIKEARENMKEAQRLKHLAELRVQPVLNLTADYTLSGDAEKFNDELKPDEESWSLGLRSGSDFSRSAEKIAFRQAALRVKQSELALEEAKLEIRREVKQVLRALERSRARIKLLSELIMQTRGKLELSQVKFARGMIDNFTVLESENELRLAESNMIQEKINFAGGKVRLQAAMGTLLKTPDFQAQTPDNDG